MTEAESTIAPAKTYPDWYSADTATFGDRVTGAREAANLTQADLAQRLGVDIKTVRSWEEDLSEPRANKLQMLAGFLNVSIRWLLTAEGQGIDSPGASPKRSAEMSGALADLTRLRAQALALAEDIGQLEKRLKSLV